MSYYRNPTENAALGNITRQMNKLNKIARRIRRRRLEGTLTFLELYNACQHFSGWNSRLLMQAILLDKDPEEKSPVSES